jgi:hypothetical protein
LAMTSRTTVPLACEPCPTATARMCCIVFLPLDTPRVELIATE